MPVKTRIKPSQYFDSVSLMVVARELARLPGVTDAAVVMGTEANKGILRQGGLLTPDAETASPNDLVIAVSAPPDILDQALDSAESLLQKKSSAAETAEFRPKTLRSAARMNQAANIAVISVAGRYAADEAWAALRNGLHVLLFSDNVSLADEIALKQYAVQHGLLLMGPGAGTAILNGVALGFANIIPPGTVGIVSAAGTGLQEVSTLLAKNGAGITQGIGTGGRDLSEAVGGLMMLAGLQALQDDPATQVIVLVSKPPAPAIAHKVLEQAARSAKSTVVCFMGGEAPGGLPANIFFALTLEDAAFMAAGLAKVCRPETPPRPEDLVIQVENFKSRLAPEQRYLRGLFSGGTLCYETQVVCEDLLSEPLWSNAPLDKANLLPDSNCSQGHSVVDLGEEEFTVGRPHPMIDNDLRIRRLLQEARDPTVGVILLDVVIGYGAHPDPAAELAPAIEKARLLAGEFDHNLVIIASVTGTQQDPQGLGRQRQALQAAGVIVCDSNAAAAELAARIVR